MKLLDFFTRTAHSEEPTEKSKARSLESYRSIWEWCLATMPLDIIVIPFVADRFSGALLLLSQKTYWWMLTISALLLLLPLFKKPLIELLLATQGVQHDASLLKLRGRFLLSGVFALIIMGDLAQRVWEVSPYFGAAVILATLCVFPWWYQSMKTKGTERELEQEAQQVVLPIETRMHLSTMQMDLLLFFMLIGPRAGFPLALLSVHLLEGGSLAIGASIVAALISLMSLAPTKGDFFAICRQCGLWSRISHQFDGYCPGCAELSLKSVRTKQERTSHFDTIEKLLKNADTALEKVKLPSIKR